MLLQGSCKAIIKAAKIAASQQSSEVGRNIALHIDMLNLLLRRLERLPLGFEHACLTVAETQRVARLLQALTDYVVLYKPMLDGNIERDGASSDAYAHLMGAFASDITTLQRLFRAGIPVWFFRPLSEACNYRVDALADMEREEIHLALDPARLKLPLIFTGAANQTEKYRAMERFTRDHMRWADPFSLPVPVIFARPNPVLPVGTQRDIRFSPGMYVT